MSRRKVTFHNLKEAKNNQASLERPGHRVSKYYIRDPRPSANFGSQWLIAGQGYNVLPANLEGIQIQNPDPVVPEPNEPWRPMPSTGIYSPSGRKNALKSFPKGELFARPENIPANYTAGVYARPLVMPVYVPRRTNGAPIPKRTNGGPAPKRSRPSRTRKAKKN